GLRDEDLRARVVAGVEVNGRAVGGAASVDVHALAERLQGAAGLDHRPLLGVGVVAGVDLNRGEVGAVRCSDVDAQALIAGDRPGGAGSATATAATAATAAAG